MAHEIRSNDGLGLVGERAWHGLGTVLPEGQLDPMRAREIAGLGWEPRLLPLCAEREVDHADGSTETTHERIDSHRAVARDDDGTILGVVGADFHPLTNRSFFELLAALGRDVETAGSFRGGRVVFALLRQTPFQVGPGDEIRPYLFVSQGHDGSRALTFKRTRVRVVCANTDASALAEGTATLSYRHTDTLEARVQAASSTLERAEAFASRDQDDVLALSFHRLASEERGAIYGAAIQAQGLPIRVVGAGVDVPKGLVELLPHARVSADKVPAVLASGRRRLVGLLDAELHPTNQLPGMEGTAWQAVQAVSYWAQHVRRGRMDSAESVLAGPVRDIKAAAYSTALAIIGRG